MNFHKTGGGLAAYRWEVTSIADGENISTNRRCIKEIE
jgi:hypothetical protein